MKTITERDGKNVNMQVVGDLHKYPDGSVHTVKEGKAVWEEGSGGDSGGSGGGVLMVTDTDGTLDKTMGEIQDAYLAGKQVIISDGDSARGVIGIVPVRFGKHEYIGSVATYAIENTGAISQPLILRDYFIFGETESLEAARNAYPAHLEPPVP